MFSAEFDTLASRIDAISEHLADEGKLGSVGARLQARRLIESYMHKRITDTSDLSLSVKERAHILIEHVLEKVRLEPKHYHAFLSVLMVYSPLYEEIVQELVGTYHQKCMDQRAQALSMSGSSTTGMCNIKIGNEC